MAPKKSKNPVELDWSTLPNCIYKRIGNGEIKSQKELADAVGPLLANIQANFRQQMERFTSYVSCLSRSLANPKSGPLWETYARKCFFT